MLWLAAMALTPPAPPPPDCSAGVLGDYNCDGCVDLEDRAHVGRRGSRDFLKTVGFSSDMAA